MNLKQFGALLRVLHQGKLVLLLLLLLLALAIANEVAIYNIGLITGDYYRILNEKDESAFIRQTIKSLLLIVSKLNGILSILLLRFIAPYFSLFQPFLY